MLHITRQKNSLNLQSDTEFLHHAWVSVLSLNCSLWWIILFYFILFYLFLIVPLHIFIFTLFNPFYYCDLVIVSCLIIVTLTIVRSQRIFIAAWLQRIFMLSTFLYNRLLMRILSQNLYPWRICVLVNSRSLISHGKFSMRLCLVANWIPLMIAFYRNFLRPVSRWNSLCRFGLRTWVSSFYLVTAEDGSN